MANTKVVSLIDGLFSVIRLSVQFWLSLRFGLTRAILGLFKYSVDTADPDEPPPNYAQFVRAIKPTRQQAMYAWLCGALSIFPALMAIPAVIRLVLPFQVQLLAFVFAALFFLSLLLYQLLESEFDGVRGNPALLFTLFIFVALGWLVLRINLIAFVFFYPGIFAKLFSYLYRRSRQAN